MKTVIILATGVLLAGSCLGQGNISVSAPAVRRNTLPPVAPAPQAEGSLQRGVRVGNPLQIINPFAPAVYGDGRAFLAPRYQDSGLRPRDTSRSFPVGLRLFSIGF